MFVPDGLKIISDILVLFYYSEIKSTNDTSRDQPNAAVISSTTTSNAESNSSMSRIEEEIKVASRLRKFTFNDLKMATRNFRPESLLGEGGFGCVFKGWIEENGTAPVKPGTGLTVAVKTLNHDGLQGHKEWLVRHFHSLGFSCKFVFSIYLVVILVFNPFFSPSTGRGEFPWRPCPSELGQTYRILH